MTESKPFHPVVKTLDDKIKNTSGWGNRFADAVQSARNSGIQEMQKIHTTSDWLRKTNEFLYWVPREGEEGKDVYNCICLVYFVLNQPTVKPLQDPIEPGASNMKDSWLTEWLHTYADALGMFLDDPESIAGIQTFRDSKPYNMKEYLEPRGGWRDFNDFFARSVKPGFRPIAAISDPRVIVSPADSTYGGQWHIRSDSGVTIKGLHWDISELLKDCPYQKEFDGGIFMHSFLGPNDYHRQHCPVGGKVIWAENIRGDCYLEVNTVPIPDTDGVKTLQATRSMDGAKYNFDAPDTPGYQFAQNRGLIVLDTEIGLIAILPMGMAQVSSVVLTAERGVVLTKGDEISYFQFGGSDIVICFQRRSNVNLTAQPGTHYKMGNVIGHAYPAGK
ncbi:MAG: hypothetical protein Q9186_004993 [Xanthomendoza sp. 1 TL-2023]